jgi:hypothetical protein
MPSRHAWLTLVQIIAGIEMLLLIAQYFLGLWTNVYAPAMFTSNSSFPSLDWHYTVGYMLFVIGLVVLILAGLARHWRVALAAVVVVVAVYSAGMFGADFVSSSPNDPIDSFGMGTMFLVALFANAALLMMTARARRASGTAAPVPAAQPASA